LANLGNLGVQLFFLVSAMTMCLMWQQRAGESDRQLKFYIRRFFRIAPLFWMAMCFYGFSWWLNDGHGTMASAGTAQIVATATFLHGFLPSAINKIVPGGWSIAIEMSFYVVFPWLANRLTTPVRMLALGLISYLVLGVAMTALIERFMPLDPGFMYYSMLTQFPIFAVGMFVYRASMRPEPLDLRLVGAITVAWLAIALVGKYGLGLNTRPVFWIQVALLAGSICFVIRRGVHLGMLSYIGNLSYSMYLFHFAVIDVFARLISAGHREGNAVYLLALLLVMVATSAVSKLSGVTFERWSSQIARVAIARLRSPNGPRLSEA